MAESTSSAAISQAVIRGLTENRSRMTGLEERCFLVDRQLHFGTGRCKPAGLNDRNGSLPLSRTLESEVPRIAFRGCLQPSNAAAKFGALKREQTYLAPGARLCDQKAKLSVR
jgi:hypothetical protein